MTPTRPEGLMNVCDIRGWGFLTGVGGMRLPEDKAVKIQDENSDVIVELRNLLPRLIQELEGM